MKGFDDVCACLKKKKADGEQLDAYATTILECCDKTMKFYAWMPGRNPNFDPDFCSGERIAGVRINRVLGFIPSGCEYHVCCRPFMDMSGSYSLFHSTVEIMANHECFAQIIAALKLYQCCSAKPTPRNDNIPDLGYYDYAKIAELVGMQCCDPCADLTLNPRIEDL